MMFFLLSIRSPIPCGWLSNSRISVLSPYIQSIHRPSLVFQIPNEKIVFHWKVKLVIYWWQNKYEPWKTTCCPRWHLKQPLSFCVRNLAQPRKMFRFQSRKCPDGLANIDPSTGKRSQPDFYTKLSDLNYALSQFHSIFCSLFSLTTTLITIIIWNLYTKWNKVQLIFIERWHIFHTIFHDVVFFTTYS